MSIILKGIDLPKSKDNRYIIQIYNDGEIQIAEEAWDDTRKGHDKLQRRYIGESKAIQIPKGHGAIKDIDTFLKDKCLTEYIEDDVFNKKYTYTLSTVAIYNAPTILESEEDDEHNT